MLKNKLYSLFEVRSYVFHSSNMLSYQIEQECMQACSEADGGQNAKAYPVGTPQKLLLQVLNVLRGTI